MGLKWLVTGGCGFIGTALTRRLLAERRHNVRVIDNLEVGTRQQLADVCEVEEIPATNLSYVLPPLATGRCHLVIGDVTDKKLMEAVAKDIDIIVHLAANTKVDFSVDQPLVDFKTNVVGTINCLEAARAAGVKRFIFASSVAALGEGDLPISEACVPQPTSPYGASKLAGEGYCSAYFRAFGLETVVLRFANVYGPYARNQSGVVASFVRQALAGKPLKIFGDGSQTRDFIFIDDLVDAICASATIPGIGGKIFQIGSGEEISILQLVDIIRRQLQKLAIVDVRVEHLTQRAGDIHRNYTNPSKAARELGWVAHTKIEEGVGQVVSWLGGTESAIC